MERAYAIKDNMAAAQKRNITQVINDYSKRLLGFIRKRVTTKLMPGRHTAGCVLSIHRQHRTDRTINELAVRRYAQQDHRQTTQT